MTHPRQLVVVQGWADTRETLLAWNRAPKAVLARWVPLSAAVALALLVAVWVVAERTTALPEPFTLPDDPVEIFSRNLLVLALHAAVCVAGFIAKSSLPLEAEGYSGFWRRVHDLAGPAAIAFVSAATAFSLATQAWVIGSALGAMAPSTGASPSELLAVLAIHALPELTAVFLPLAAFLVAARAGAWHQLLGATIATTAVAVPLLVVSAVLEVHVTPVVLRALHFV